MKQFHRIFAAFLLVFLLFEAEGLAYVGKYRSIEITGQEKFVARVKGALQLIEEKAPEAWAIVRDHVKKIESAAATGMFPYLPGSVAVISENVAFCSITWCAGAIIHDAFHAKLFDDYLVEHSAPVPDSAWSGPQAEKTCIAFQIPQMRLLGADYRETAYWRSRLESSAPGPCAGDCPHA